MENDIKYYPLTHPQKGIWYTEKLYPDTSINNIAATLRLKGDINYKILEKAINTIIKDNDSLRLRFVERNGTPYQYISKYEIIKIDYYDFSNSDLNSLYEWDTQQSQTPFTIVNSSLCYFTILKISGNETGIYCKLHHLISDGWSIVQIGNKILEYYDILAKDMEVFSEDIPSYVEYINSELSYEESDKFNKDKEYWKGKYSKIPELTSLKSNNSKMINTKAKRKTFIIPSGIAKQLRQYCNDAKTYIFPIFFSALSIYISRITTKDDIVIATPVLNRSNAREKNTIGMFVKTVPVRINVNCELNFNEFIQELTKEWLGTLRHQKYPYDLILKGIRGQYKVTDKLYDILISYQNAKFIKGQQSSMHEGRWHFCGHQQDSLYIHINDREDNGNLIIDYDYQTQLFTAKEIEYIHKHLLTLIQNAIKNPLQKVSKIELLDDEEKNRVLYKFNESKYEYPREKTINEVFEEQVFKAPDQIAIVYDDKQITYMDLSKKADKLARYLRMQGIVPDSIVAIKMKRSLEMIISIIAVLKAGGSFLPIDPELPEDRIQYMLNDSCANILIVNEENQIEEVYNGKILNINSINNMTIETSNLNNINKPNDLAYIIYTSGSTGKPKAVMIEHKSVINFAESIKQRLDYSSPNTVLSVTTMCFDIFIFEVFPTLFYGLKLIISNEKEQKIPELLSKLIVKNGVTKIMTTPSRMQLLAFGQKDLSCFKVLKEIILGGEPFPEKLLLKLKDITNAKIYNMYGPTETTVYSTFKDLNDTRKINIGKPIFNTQIYILDKHMNPVPIGVQGEIYIGGDGLARGYYRKEELTNKKFIANPFNSKEIIYQTGDYGRWYPQGEIECLGRIDSQVKIRGFRIELGEIESQILSYESIKDTVVTYREDQNGRNYLCAYYVSHGDINIFDLKKELAKVLPNYMIPSCFIKIDKIPLNANGKIDKKALPEPDSNILVNAEYQPPRNKIDSKLIEVWSKILNIKKIGIDDNIFELGADSLSIINFQTTIITNKWNLTTQDFYKYQTIREISDKISGQIINNDSSNMNKIYIRDKITIKEKIISERTNFENVLLTGGTGFLGSHILDYLITNTNANVYCLVRSELNDLQNAIMRFTKTMNYYFNEKYETLIGKRIFIVNGDISLKNLGLDQIKYKQLCSIINAVINAAANVNYYGDYNEFYKVNVQGMNNCIDFCSLSKIPFYHISTLGVSGHFLVEQQSKGIKFTENDLYIGQKYNDNVYIRSKFEAENLLNMYINNGLQATIYRVGNLTGRYLDGRFQQNQKNNAFANTIHSIIKLGMINEDLLSQELEFTPVDLCSKAIGELMSHIECNNKVFHVFNHETVKMKDIIGMFSNLGISIKVVDNGTFKKHIINIAKDKEKSKYLSGVINDITKNYNLKYESSVNINSNITLSYLNQLKFKWPKIDLIYLCKIFTRMGIAVNESGFIDEVI